MNKRGISTIIASILLILIVISLFSVIVYFVKKNTEKAIEQGSESLEKMLNCDEVNLEISSVCFSTGGCGKDKGGVCDIIQVMIKNNNKISYNEGFRLKLSTGYSDTFKVVENSLEPYSARYITHILPVEEKKENINWIKLYPIINGKTCDSKEYKFDIRGVECHA